MTNFHKILIKNIRAREQTSFKMVNFQKQRAITAKSLVQYGPLSNLKTIVLNNVTKFHKILIKSIRFREGTSSGQTCVRKYLRIDGRTNGQG